jgi:hypothetical protein
MDISRNWLFISEETQNLIKDKFIFMAGVGLGSQIAISLARIGFKKFILADGDVFSESNLNRQHCFLSDLNKNKAEVTHDYLKNIDPKIQTVVFPYFLKNDDLENFIQKSDYVINCIDFDSPEYLTCHRLCKKYNKKEIFVINLGFGTVAAISSSESPDFQDFFQEDDFAKMKNILITHFVMNGCANKENIELIVSRYQQEKHNNPEPQIVAGCYLSSILTMKIILNDIENKNVQFFPFIYSLDPLI